MKKVFIIILSCLLTILIISFGKINVIKIDNANIIKQIADFKKNNEMIDSDILESEDKIELLKEENNDKWQELNIWQKTKEKITAALPQ